MSPRRYLVRMLIFLSVVVGGCVFLFPALSQAFWSNAPLNAVILGALGLGIIYIIRQVALLSPEVVWIENFRQDRAPSSSTRPPRLLGPMATILGNNAAKLSLSALSVRSLLDGISSRLDEARDISRYMIGVLVFLGLLGTFWGLLQTVGSVGGVIASLDVGENDISSIFRDLKTGLEAPLSGMGTAFSSSLFGLAGSLILGFLDLQAGQAQNRFYNDVEEWLAGVTKLSSGGGVDGDQSIPVYIQALLEHTADNLDNLRDVLARSEERQMAANASAGQLNEKLAVLVDAMKAEQLLLKHATTTQGELSDIVRKLAKTDSDPVNESIQLHLRNIDAYLAQISRDLPQAHTQLSKDIRNEMKLLAKTIAAIGQPGSVV